MSMVGTPRPVCRTSAQSAARSINAARMPPWVKRRSTLTTHSSRHFARISINREFSEELAILDEAGAVRQRVVEAARNGVGLVREPMDAARAGRARGYRLDQRAAQPELARAPRPEQILQIAVVADRPAGAVTRPESRRC